MKIRLYKRIALCLALGFSVSVFAQKHSKNFNESFKVNKDVKVEINASNAEIDVTTWNKNEVAVNAVITVEGLTKKEAEKYLKKWNFEALGNSKKVEVNAKSGGYLYFGDHDFKFDFDMSNIVIPEINMPDIDFEMPEISIPDIKIPEINIDIDRILDDIDEYDFKNRDHDYDGKFTYEINGKKKTTVIKSKKDWEKFKKTEDYQVWKKDLQKQIKDAQASIKKIDKKKIEEEIRKAKIAVEKINKKELEKSLAIARKSIEKMKIDMENSFNNGESTIVIEENGNKKKVKFTSKITIKVPKGATFDLNTRHCKVKLPKGKTNGKVSYGSLNAAGIDGGELKVSYAAPVTIESLNTCTLFLNNVTDAKIASVTNTTLSSNYGELEVSNINSNTTLKSSFGELVVKSLNQSLNNLKVELRHSDASINFGNLKNVLKINPNSYFDKELTYSDLKKKGNESYVTGDFVARTKDGKLNISAKYSELVIK